VAPGDKPTITYSAPTPSEWDVCPNLQSATSYPWDIGCVSSYSVSSISTRKDRRGHHNRAPGAQPGTEQSLFLFTTSYQPVSMGKWSFTYNNNKNYYVY
jgi:hypothetical protein